MYNLKTRYKYALIIPIVIFAYNNITLAIKTNYYKLTDTTQIIENIASYLITAVLIYIVTVLFFSLETIIRAYITDRTNPTSRKVREELQSTPIEKKLQTLDRYDKQIQERSVVKSVLFQVGLLMLILTYSITSTKLTIGTGIALSIYLQLLIEQIKEMKEKKNIASWFWQIATPISTNSQLIYLGVSIILYTVTLLTVLKIKI